MSHVEFGRHRTGSVVYVVRPPLVRDNQRTALGANGWYCYYRTGAKPVSDKAFVELVDKTSA